MGDYQYLFTPLKLGKVVIKNRIIFSPHATGHFDRQNYVANERVKGYYEERAKGGVGWIVIGTASVDERADYYPGGAKPGWWKDEVIPGIKEIVDRVHSYDCKISAQISHPGAIQWPISENTISYPSYAPSQIGSAHLPFNIPHELEMEEILEIEEKFADAAERVKKTGCDGVEIMGVHEKLLGQFASPLLNRRTDQYGGSTENRFRFWVEVVQKVRERVGPDYLVGVRINDQDGAAGGLSLEESIEGAKLIEATGAVDYISLCTGMYRGGHCIPSHYTGFEPGYRAPLTAQFKKALKLPVLMAGKINDPSVAERLIADGATDAALICRQLIADPFFAKKVMEGREEDIRPCIYCNQGCCWLDVLAPGSAGVRCQVNPTAGEEFRWGSHTFFKSSERKKVLIIGAGPGGLECARTLAERGHSVAIYEKGDEPGGQIRLLRQLPGGRDEFYTFIDWLDNQISRLDVNLYFGSEITEENLDEILEKEQPDEIICATGARAGKDGTSATVPFPIPGHDLPHVFTYEDVIDGAELGQRVVVLDGLGERTAPGIAEMLAEQGKQVEIVAVDIWWQKLLLVWTEMTDIYSRLGALGVKYTPSTWAIEIKETSVSCIEPFTGKTSETAADSVVLVTAKYSNTALYKAIKAKGIKPHLIGDAVAPRFMLNAVRDGYELARKI